GDSWGCQRGHTEHPPGVSPRGRSNGHSCLRQQRLPGRIAVAAFEDGVREPLVMFAKCSTILRPKVPIVSARGRNRLSAPGHASWTVLQGRPHVYKEQHMRATVMFSAGDVRIETVPDARLSEPTDALIRVTRAAICGSDLWPYKSIEPSETGRRMGH